LRASKADLEQARERSSARLLERQRALQAKIDRGYDDYLEGRISDTLWARKSADWEAELTTVTAELSSLDRPATTFVTAGEKILELVKRAGILYKTQNPAEQRRVLESVLSNCTFDRGSVCPTYKKPFDLFARAAETGEWRGRRDSNPIFSTTIDSDHSVMDTLVRRARCGQQATDDDRTRVSRLCAEAGRPRPNPARSRQPSARLLVSVNRLQRQASARLLP
jgi:hypothetical protein